MKEYHGQKTSYQEYVRSLNILEELSFFKKLNCKYQTQLLDVQINHKLGIDFPQNRRTRLYKISKQIFFHALYLRPLSWMQNIINHAPSAYHKLMKTTLEKHSKVLSDTELALFFDVDLNKVVQYLKDTNGRQRKL